MPRLPSVLALAATLAFFSLVPSMVYGTGTEAKAPEPKNAIAPRFDGKISVAGTTEWVEPETVGKYKCVRVLIRRSKPTGIDTCLAQADASPSTQLILKYANRNPGTTPDLKKYVNSVQGEIKQWRELAAKKSVFFPIVTPIEDPKNVAFAIPYMPSFTDYIGDKGVMTIPQLHDFFDKLLSALELFYKERRSRFPIAADSILVNVQKNVPIPVLYDLHSRFLWAAPLPAAPENVEGEGFMLKSIDLVGLVTVFFAAMTPKKAAPGQLGKIELPITCLSFLRAVYRGSGGLATRDQFLTDACLSVRSED